MFRISTLYEARLPLKRNTPVLSGSAGLVGVDGGVGAVLVEDSFVVIEAQRICLRAFAGDQHGITFVEHIQVVGLRRLPSLIGGVGISGTHVAGGSRVASQFAGCIGR